MSVISTDRLASLKAAALEGIDKFISKAKREQRQAVEIAAWNAEVEARKRAKKAQKREHRAARVRAGLPPIEPKNPQGPFIAIVDQDGQVQIALRDSL